MKRSNIADTFKLSSIVLGGIAVVFAALEMPRELLLTPGFWLIVIFVTFLAPRLTMTLPYARFAIGFSDACVFLAFVLYGGPAAIIIAAIETAANCIFIMRRGFAFGRLMIPTNVAINAISMTLTYLLWLKTPTAPFITPVVGSTQHLIATLGAVALTHFIFSSFLAAVFQSIKERKNIFAIWRRDCFSSSMAQLVGAGLAALVYKILHFGDLVTGTIAFVSLALIYLSYRRSIADINRAIQMAEEAERAKSEVERTRRVEAEAYAGELAESLKNQEFAYTALRKSEQDFQHAALHDSLTRLANRKMFGDMLRRLINEYQDDPTKTFYVLFLDIHRFKNINDSLGHTIGDKVLMVAAKRFTRMLNPKDLVARIGGDEFAIVLKDLSTVGKARKVAQRIFDTISQPFALSGNRISIAVNIGIAPCDAEYRTPEEILRDADIAMHHAKTTQEGVAIFTRELRSRFLERVRIEMDLEQAVERNELSMSYQPLVRLTDGKLLGLEALLRWNHHEFGNVPPNKFIPIAEDSGLIVPITTWILKQTTRQIAEWQKISPAYRDLIVSVNISGKHLSNEDLLEDIERAIATSDIRPACLKLEITESAAMENPEFTAKLLKKLKRIGVALSIDDFGTGYSSLSILHKLPFDTLKIDRSFVSAVGEDGEGSEVLQTIISLAKNLRMSVIAEGIETEAQLALLQNLGCDYGQGYLMARPQTVDKMETALYEGREWLPFKRDAERERPRNGSKHPDRDISIM